MGWHGPRGSCGCCGENAPCFCPVLCECDEPELRGKNPVTKTIQIANFPAALEDHGTIACGDPGNPYKSVYYGVFGLNQINGQYNLSLNFLDLTQCEWGSAKQFSCTVQVAEGQCRPTEFEACQNLSASFMQYQLECIALIRDNKLSVYVKEGDFTSAFTCFDNQAPVVIWTPFFGFARLWFETSLAYRERWCEDNKSTLVIDRNYLLYGTEDDGTACANPQGLSTANCRKTPVDDFIPVYVDFTATLSERSSGAISGYGFIVQDLQEISAIRAYGANYQESYVIEGLDALNGNYFSEIDGTNCKVKPFLYSVPITVKAFLYSTYPPCFIVNTGRETTGIAYLYGEPNELSDTYSVSVACVFDDLHDYYMTGLRFPVGVGVTLVQDCERRCSTSSSPDICLTLPEAMQMTACMYPVF